MQKKKEKNIEYKINVAKNGKHLFLIAETLKNAAEAFNVLRPIKENFPTKLGYHITLTEWGLKGTVLAN